MVYISSRAHVRLFFTYIVPQVNILDDELLEGLETFQVDCCEHSIAFLHQLHSVVAVSFLCQFCFASGVNTVSLSVHLFCLPMT